MRRIARIFLKRPFVLVVVVVWMIVSPLMAQGEEGVWNLPAPEVNSAVSLEEAFVARRTVRSFRGDPLTERQLAQLLWAANGINPKREGRRTVPSAGALFPLDLYVVVGDPGVREGAAGVYHYDAWSHALRMLQPGDKRKGLAQSCVGQMWVARAPVVIVIAGEYERTTRKYGERGIRYVHMEAGHAAQNLLLQTRTVGLSAGIVGAFYDDTVSQVLGLPSTHRPLLVLPVGSPR